MANKRIPLESDRFYHIYNHVVGNENLFRNDENYQYFLRKYAECCNPIVETFAYCLMPNHFHILIRIKSEQELIDFYLKKYPKLDSAGFENPQGLNLIPIQNSKHFGSFFNAYAKAYNKQYQRRGSLFEDDFRRIEVKSEEYLRKLVHYIHFNPVHHGFAEDICDWKYSSYKTFLSQKPTCLKRQQVIRVNA